MLPRLNNTYFFKTKLSELIEIYKEMGHYARNKKELESLQCFVMHPLLKREKEALSYESKLNYNFIHLFYHRAKGDFKRSYKYAIRKVEILESQPEKINEDPLHYILALNTLSMNLLELNKNEEFLETLEKLQTLPQRFPNAASDSMRINALARVYNNQMRYYNKRGEYTESKDIVQKVEVLINNSYHKIDKSLELSLYYNIAFTYFVAENYDRALEWVNMAMIETNIHSRTDVLSSVKILNLIIHFELGNLDLLDYLVNSTHDLLKKRNRLNEFEALFINFIRNKLCKTSDSNELKESFLELRKKIDDIAHIPFERRIIENLEFNSWLDSKIENKPLAQIVGERNRVKTISKSLQYH